MRRELFALLVVVVIARWSVHTARGARAPDAIERPIGRQECPPEASLPRLVRPIPTVEAGVRSYATGDIDKPHPEVCNSDESGVQLKFKNKKISSLAWRCNGPQ